MPVVEVPDAGGQPIVGRLPRLLAMLAWLAGVREARIADVARRFGMSEDEVVSELELAACCGLPPYTPDTLIELIVDGDRVFADHVGDLGRPRRLTPGEGFAVAAAARAMMAAAGADPDGSLASALAKLEAALGEDRLVVDIDAPEHLPELRSAVAAGAVVEIEYASAGRGEVSRRQVDPYQVVLREGRWYLDGWCHRAGGLRRFQVDRVRSVRETGTRFERSKAPMPELDDPHAFVGGAEAVRTRIAVPAEAAWLATRFAVGEAIDLRDGRKELTVMVGGRRWLEGLMLRLGPGAEVLDPPEMRRIASAGARRALKRYELGSEAMK